MSPSNSSIMFGRLGEKKNWAVGSLICSDPFSSLLYQRSWIIWTIVEPERVTNNSADFFLHNLQSRKYRKKRVLCIRFTWLFFPHCTLRTTVCVCVYTIWNFQNLRFFCFIINPLACQTFFRSKRFEQIWEERVRLNELMVVCFLLLQTPTNPNPSWREHQRYYRFYFRRERKKKGEGMGFTNAAASICHYYWPQGKSFRRGLKLKLSIWSKG